MKRFGFLAFLSFALLAVCFSFSGKNFLISTVSATSTVDTLAPTTPTIVSVSSPSYSQLSLYWSTSTDNIAVEGYQVFRSGVFIATTTSLSYLDSGLTASTSYFYYVVAFDEAKNLSTRSLTFLGTTQRLPDTQAPSVPSGLSAVAISASQINLSWSVSIDNVAVANYRIYRNGAMIATSQTNSYSDATLSGSTLYSYNISAVDSSSNDSALSDAFSATTQAIADIQPPTTPSGLSATAISTSQINLSWLASIDNVGVVGYRIYRDYFLIATTSLTYYNNTALSAGTYYNYSVSAYDAAHNYSSQAVGVSVQTNSNVATSTLSDSQSPTAPGSLSALVVSASQINLSWVPSTDNVAVIGYRIYRNGSFVGTSTTVSYYNTGLSASTTYRYNVSAFDAKRNHSALSATTTIKTLLAVNDTQKPTAPTSLVARAISSSRVDLSWIASTDNIGVVGYRIYRNGSLIGSSTAASYYNTGLTALTKYYYSVSAFDAARNFSATTTTSVLTATSSTQVSSSTNSYAKSTSTSGVLSGASSATVETVTSAESQPLPTISTRTELTSACKTVYEKVVGAVASTDSANRYAIASFIQNGTETTKVLGAGERGGVISSFSNTFKRLPANQNDWQDVIKIANGRWPKQRNASLEETNKANAFKKIYRRLPSMSNANDNAAVTILTYGLRPSNRSLINEAASIKSFKYIYGRAPSSAADWDIVRAIAYSGSKR